jgi:transposase, IS30 family
MGEQYSQLTDKDRIEIYALLKANCSRREIASKLERDPKTIREEIKRNSGLRGYRPQQAHALAMERRTQARRPVKMTAPVIAHIEAKLREQWSPEQISATMMNAGLTPVSPERIYQHVWRDKAQGGVLWRELRLAGRDRRRKRYGKKDWRGRIPGRVDIDKRPAHVERRKQLGHWEADLVSGKHHRGFLVTLVERKSRYTLIGHVERKQSDAVTTEIVRLLRPHADRVRTLTFDNGREFTGHLQLAQRLKCKTYFAKPYHSWERGTNENTNGLIRQYFPKTMGLRQVSGQEREHVMRRLNNRPRKTLGFDTPMDVFSRRA